MHVAAGPSAALCISLLAFTSQAICTYPMMPECASPRRFSKKDVIVSPSILSADFARLGEQVHSLHPWLTNLNTIHPPSIFGTLKHIGDEAAAERCKFTLAGQGG
jgi:hypothetical protein